MTEQQRPWYREPWPWLVMIPPAAAVVAGAITIWIAVVSADGLVADDYYKQGLAINREIARERRATELRLGARVEFGEGRVQVAIEGDAEPRAVMLQLAHATRPGLDQSLRLMRAPDGRYGAALTDLAPGRWHVSIEDEQRAWRLTGTVRGAPRGMLQLSSRAGAALR